VADARKQPLNRLRTLLREKKPAFGAIATMPSLQAVQVIANSGFDWVIVDLEHGAIDLAAAHAMIVATSGTPCVPLARVADNQPHLAKTPMDLGALGINFR
jgi:4-hydroxy-2-oxoheptanedioate aldolase